jgi:septal ring factor EnvC (AmiA/AmiB activator)
MSLTPQVGPESSENEPRIQEQGGQPADRSLKVYAGLLAVALAIGVAEGIYAFVLTQRVRVLEDGLQSQILQHDETLGELQSRIGSAEEHFEGLQGDLSGTKNTLEKAQLELRRTRLTADALARQQKETSENLAGQLGALAAAQNSTSGTVGSLSTEVNVVKSDITSTKIDLASTRSELQRVIGDLGVQSDLIARNRDELAELRLRGDRDYYEFDLRKTKQPQKFPGGMALQLKKTDVKRQKYTVDLLADDRRIEKKDKTSNEPVQFYQQGMRTPTEVVVNQIYKDRIVGYISMPKQRAARLSGAETVVGQPAVRGT